MNASKLLRLAIVASLATSVTLSPVASPLQAEDTVYIRSGDNSSTETKLVGEVLDFTGTQLMLRLTAGNQRAVPAARVVRVETSHAPEHAAGDKLLEASQCQQALAQYRAAMDKEERRWVRREILSNIVWCHRELRDVPAAVQNFLLLVQSDPATPFFDCIPLAWTNEGQAPQTEQAATAWLESGRRPVEALIGASHLLAGKQRDAALDRLKSLSLESDERVALIAKAQTWRLTGPAANDRQIDIWSAEIDKAPAALRAGPYFALGRVLASRKLSERAALAYLRVPIVFPRDRTLAALALMEAARELEAIGKKPEAAGLYREIVDGYPLSSVAAEAKSRAAALESETEK